MRSLRECQRHLRHAGPLGMRDLAQARGFEPPVSGNEFARALLSPQERTWEQQILTPSGTALGGRVRLAARSDGSWAVHFHLHNSGAIDYGFRVVAILRTGTGLSLACEHAGSVEGTESTTLERAPRRDSDHHEQGVHPLVRRHWAAIESGDARFWVVKDYSAGTLVDALQDLARAVVDAGASVAGAAAGVVVTLGAAAGRLAGDLGMGAPFAVLGGVVAFALTGGVVLAVAAGAAAGAAADAAIRQRALSAEEAAFAHTVYGASLPPRERIILTNLAGLGGRPFTMPGLDGNIYLNMGADFDDPMPRVPETGQVDRARSRTLIHELAHAWQIHNARFLPGMVCLGIRNQAAYELGVDVYDYGPPGPHWGQFNLEQQASIIEDWMAGVPTAVVPHRKPADPNDPYFGYIRDHVRLGRT